MIKLLIELKGTLRLMTGAMSSATAEVLAVDLGDRFRSSGLETTIRPVAEESVFGSVTPDRPYKVLIVINGHSLTTEPVSREVAEIVHQAAAAMELTHAIGW